MNISKYFFKKSRLIFLYLLGLILIAILIYRYPYAFDATYLKNNTLSESSKALLTKLNKPLCFELTTLDTDIATQARTMISLFQKENPNIQLKVFQSTLSPKEKNVSYLQTNHTLSITYNEQRKIVDLDKKQIHEETFANLIHHVLRNKEEWTVFLSGHGEQDPMGNENRNLSQLTSNLKEKGLNIAALNFSETGTIPDNTKVLVIADSQKPMLPKEVDIILDYLDRGGNLLWLVNPESVHGLDKLNKRLGIQWSNETILDTKAHSMGTPHPAISVIMHYPEHPLTHSLDMFTVFPWATPLDYSFSTSLGWNPKPFLITQASTHLEKDQHKHSRHFCIGITLQKEKQRIVVVGNSHFLSNSTLHNYGNLMLAHNIFNWLNDTDVLLSAPSKLAIDLAFTDSSFIQVARKYLFPYFLPLVFLWLAWQKKRSRYQKHRSC